MRSPMVFVFGALAALATAAADVGVIDQEALMARLATRDARLVVLDVRTPEEYAAGHVPGAINLPHDAIESRLAELMAHREQDVVVYCRSGRRTKLALETLSAHGFEHLWHLEGDMLAWQAANRPLETSAKPGAAPAPGRQ